MKKPDIPEDHQYKMGTINQSCTQCPWEGSSLKYEISKCPECGASASVPVLKFGGMEVSIPKKNHFEMKNRWGSGSGGVWIDEVDIPDTIVFMMKNSDFWFD